MRRRYSASATSLGLAVALASAPVSAAPPEDDAAEAVDATSSTPSEAVDATSSTPSEALEPEALDPKAQKRERRARFSDAAIFDAYSGGAPKGDWALELSGGFPWSRLRGQYGVGKGFTVLGDVETALGRRWRPAVGVGLRWVDRPHFRLGGELLLGWLIQTTPELPRRGFQPEWRLRMAAPVGRFAPYLTLGMRTSILFDRTVIVSADGEDTRWRARPLLSLWGTLGLAIAINQHVGIDVGIDAPWIDVPQLTIPGFHLGLVIGDW